MGNMAVMDFGHVEIPVFHPFLQLPGLADPMLRQTVSCGKSGRSKVGVLTQLPGSLAEGREQIAKYLIVHGRAGAKRHAMRMPVFRGDRGHSHEIVRARYRH